MTDNGMESGVKAKIANLVIDVESYRNKRLGKQLAKLRNHPTWCIDSLQVQDNAIVVGSGWAVPSATMKGLVINGETVEDFNPEKPRPDLNETFWYLGGEDALGFSFRAKLCGEPRVLEIEAIAKREREQEFFFPYYYPLEQIYPIPEAERRRKVHGTEDEETFLLQGATAVRSLNRALQPFGKSLKDFSRILDWGCGCGRITRYLGDLSRTITGVDIDKDNIAWCREHLPFGLFQSIPFRPPTQLPPAGFDLILGISVFSHLGEADQDSWLQELSRITAPDGILLLSVLGGGALSKARPENVRYYQWKKEGFTTLGWNFDLGEVLAEGLYQNVFHNPEYIRKRWGEYFQVIDILPEFIGNNQDLVILQKE